MPLDSLTSSISAGLTIDARKNITGADYQPIQNNTTITKRVALGTAVANGVAGGADSLVSFIQSIAASGTATIDLRALTDILNQGAQVWARLKGLLIRLLSVADDATNGTAATQVVIGNAAMNANTLFLGAAAHTIVLKNGCFVAWGDPGAAGNTVSAAAKDVLITNSDAGVAAKVQFSAVGGTS